MSFRKDRVRILGFVKKRDDLSQEEFERRWLQHADIFPSIAIAQKNVLKYEQMHKNQEICGILEGFRLSGPRCDGIALMEFESYEKFLEIFEDEEYKNVVLPDELEFIDRPNCTTLAFNFATVLDKERSE